MVVLNLSCFSINLCGLVQHNLQSHAYKEKPKKETSHDFEGDPDEKDNIPCFEFKTKQKTSPILKQKKGRRFA
ncbi:hypothetical protein A0J61_02312 [Choanephora cucurbitarum]|uniref:Uncharacterized protein n=1 Tax=Choanephora cucurbitarum TaxID=101091 RepID=A0A1C7NKI0_9FUNG|nr:hypothetical protein A0J61_02312 [Choanephora cucurbitarum]